MSFTVTTKHRHFSGENWFCYMMSCFLYISLFFLICFCFCFCFLILYLSITTTFEVCLSLFFLHEHIRENLICLRLPQLFSLAVTTPLVLESVRWDNIASLEIGYVPLKSLVLNTRDRCRPSAPLWLALALLPLPFAFAILETFDWGGSRDNTNLRTWRWRG